MPNICTVTDISTFFDSIAQGNLVSLQDALSTKKTDIDARDSAGRTALHIAVIAATADTCQYLIDHGANVDIWTGQGETIIHLAAKRGEVDILRTVMESVATKQQDLHSEYQPLGCTKAGYGQLRSIHVNCLTETYLMSPLYIAVALAHVEVAELLLTTYHANANVLAGQYDAQRGTRTAHILEAALQHPRAICRPLLKMLLEHGASLLDPSTDTVSRSLLFLALQRAEDTLDIFAEFDCQNFMVAITKTVWFESMSCHNALTKAIEHGLENAALKLLLYGAPPQLDFTSPFEIIAGSNPPSQKSHEAAEGAFWQPILKAAMHEMPRLIINLLHLGADPNSRLTDHQARQMTHHRDCRTVLDIVKAKLIGLRYWSKDEERVSCEIRGTTEEAKQLHRKENAISRLIKSYEEVEAKLISIGAEMSDGLNLHDPPTHRSHKRTQLRSLNFSKAHDQIVPQLKEVDVKKLHTLENGCQAVLAACREGNVPLLKALTLGKWGENLKFTPISISAISGYSKGPFLAAVESKNYNMARTIIQIAKVQHIDCLDSEENDLFNVLVDDQHSVSTIKRVSAQVKSTVTAKKIVFDSNTCFAAEKQKDMEMLRFAIEIESSFTLEQRDIDRRIHHSWALVEHGDWPDAFEEYIKATGAPFKHIVVGGKLKGNYQLDRLHQLSPLLQAARSGNLHMVQFFLKKDRAMAAYKHFAENHDFTTRKARPSQSRAAFLSTIEKWMDNRGKDVMHRKLNVA